MARYLEQWLRFKWNTPRPDKIEHEQRENDLRVTRVFGTRDGAELLNIMLSETYCTISHVPGGKCCDTAFNEGRRAVIHEILEALDRAEKQVHGRPDTDSSDYDDADLRQR